jgi:hypothetical protein
MIAMQYSFILPADYDMTVIDRRIADKGQLTDGLVGLVFKAYLSSRKTADGASASENRYAPFYLWDSTDAMNDFLAGPGFAAVSQAFGWPSVKTWAVWHAQFGEAIGRARFATRELIPVSPHIQLDELRVAERSRAQSCMTEHRGLAAVAGFEPTTWSVVRFQLWENLPPGLQAGDENVYSVGHISRGTVQEPAGQLLAPAG